MAHRKSAKKRIRQNVKHNLGNKAIKSRLKTFSKKLSAAVAENRIEDAEKLLSSAYTLYDQAAAKGVIHANHAARNKSRICAKVLAAKSAS